VIVPPFRRGCGASEALPWHERCNSQCVVKFTISIFALAMTACTFAGAARLEAVFDHPGTPNVRAMVDPAIGVTKMDELTDVGHQAANFVLLSAGIGWGTDGVFATGGLDVVRVPAPGQGIGAEAGVRVRFDLHRCLRWSIGAGPTGLLEQLRAENRVDAYGPNPRVTRVYHDATAFAGWSSCDWKMARAFESPIVGVSYEVGVAELLFAPGP
jgi:hypothetical protein